MRDIIITLIVFASLPYTLKKPYIGVLAWVWISVMNPHRLSWGFAHDFPFAAIIAATTLVALLITPGPKQLPKAGATYLMIGFTLWMALTTATAIHPEDSFEMLKKVSKIMTMTFVCMMLIRTKEQIHWFLWTLVGSIAYYGVKGGIFTIVNGGSFRVWGPPGTYIEGNNEVALAMVTIIPMLYYLHLQFKNKWINRAVIACIPLCGLAALGSYSRGALLATASMALFLWLKSPKKAALGVAMAMIVPLAVVFMPDQWGERMDTIGTYQEDASAMGRINAWWMAFNLASDRLMGGGFEIYDAGVFSRYAPVPTDIHAAHSIYFQCLGEHGFVGLFLYLALAVACWRKAGWVIRQVKTMPDYAWAGQMATMIQVSMVCFGVGGAFLSLLYFDVPYYLMAALLVTARVVEQAVGQQQRDAALALRQSAASPPLQALP